MRKLLLVALLASASACSWDEEHSDVQLQVNGIPADADHLNVVVTPSDPSGTAKTYKPQFQPMDAGWGPRSVTLDFPQPATTGTFSVDVTAADRSDNPLPAHGVQSGIPLPVTPPGPLQLQITLQ